jgi:hypothetical protein
MCKFQFPTVIYTTRKRITHTLWNLLCLSLTAARQNTALFGIIFFEKVNLNIAFKQLARYHLVSVLHIHTHTNKTGNVCIM